MILSVLEFPKTLNPDAKSPHLIVIKGVHSL